MKIALDYNAALRQRAGIGRYTRDLVRAWLELRTDDELVLFYAARDLAPDHWGLRDLHDLQAHFDRIRSVPIPLSERHLTIVWQRVRMPLAVERWIGSADLVHAPDFVLPPVRRTPTLLTVHDLTFRVHPETAHTNLRRYLDAAVPRSLRRATHILADSQSTKRDLEQLMQVDPDRVSVLYPGVGTQFRRVTNADQISAIRERYALPDRFLFFISTLEPRKNLERLMQAYTEAVDQIGIAPTELPLLLAGKPGWLSDPIVTRAHNTPGVRLLGPVDDADLPTLYSLATATLYPSLYEGFGFPPLESLACGTPVVVANTSSLPEIVGDLGVTVDPLVISSIAAGIDRVLSDPSITEQARQRGPDHAAQFSWRTTAHHLHTIYARLVQGLPGSPPRAASI